MSIKVRYRCWRPQLRSLTCKNTTIRAGYPGGPPRTRIVSRTSPDGVTWSWRFLSFLPKSPFFVSIDRELPRTASVVMQEGLSHFVFRTWYKGPCCLLFASCPGPFSRIHFLSLSLSLLFFYFLILFYRLFRPLNASVYCWQQQRGDIPRPIDREYEFVVFCHCHLTH